jgi:plastocyanin
MYLRSILPLTGTLAIAMLAGCAGGAGTPSSTPAAQQAPMKIGFSDGGLEPAKKTKTFGVGIRLVNEKPDNDPTYGKLVGYFKGAKSKKAHVVTIKVGENVVFTNVDGTLTHTGSFLGDASSQGANWPTEFNGSETASPAGTDISTTNFSTGPLSPGNSSAVYVANVPGFYMFGCAFHYDDAGMRDIIIVQ